MSTAHIEPTLIIYQCRSTTSALDNISHFDNCSTAVRSFPMLIERINRSPRQMLPGGLCIKLIGSKCSVGPKTTASRKDEEHRHSTAVHCSVLLRIRQFPYVAYVDRLVGWSIQSLVHSFIHSFTHPSLIHSLTHSLTHSFTHSLIGWL